MKFTVELNMDEYCGGENCFDDEDFISDVKRSVKDQVAREIIAKYISGYYADDNVKELIKETINEHIGEIIKAIIDKVSQSVEHKKQIAEITPRASVFAAINKENEDYFNTQIEKCIAKKFKT